ncbi:MAG: site-2 protease family protein [Candidatus Omnitrophica bacterium]|jgi:Zn-dependent protease|nr:site-2 protease family protein [Candidatus Omnitrophota bacterium]
MLILIFVVLLLAYSIILHEIAHGAVAFLLGDPTARDQKRLTLNPLRHIDPVGTILLPLILVLVKSPALLGWAKPVPFDPRYFKNPRIGIALVSAAGPLMNFILAALCALVFKLAPAGSAPKAVAFYGVIMNTVLGLFNLIPIPPMDGSKVVGVFLPPALRKAYFSVERYGFIIIFVLLYFGLASKLLAPVYTTLIRHLTTA